MIDTILFSAVWPVLGAILLYVLRGYLAAWIRRSAESGFDKQIEILRSELRTSENAITAQLTSKQRQLDSLREGALLGATSRRTALDARRLLAVERIWNGVMILAPLKLASEIMGRINFEAAAPEAPRNENVQRMFGTLGANFDLSKLSTNEAVKERPFVSETAWAYYSAYSAIVFFAFMQMKSLELGVDGTKFLKSDSVNKLVMAALPHYSDYIKQYGPGGYHLLLEELEKRLLVELQNMLEGKESDAAAVATAANILQVAEAVQAEAAATLSQSKA